MKQWRTCHRIGCQCETCVQNHPEWHDLYGDDDEEELSHAD